MPKSAQIEKKGKGGRPSPLNDFMDVMRELYLSGKTDQEVANLLHIDISTITKWKQRNKEFFTSLKEWKEKADEKVIRSLYERACGYEHPEVHVSNYLGQITLTPLIKRYPPDATSMIFWLKNRQPDKWREKQEIVQTIERAGQIDVSKLTNDDLAQLSNMLKRIQGEKEPEKVPAEKSESAKTD